MFRTKIRTLREAAGYKSQQSFADAFGVAQSTVGGWEAGKREPNYETVNRLAHFFSVPVGYLLKESMEDEYSARFRNNLFRFLAEQEPPVDDGEALYDYQEFQSILDSTYSLSLAESCIVAKKIRKTLDFFLQDDSDIISGEYCEANKKTVGVNESTPTAEQDEEIMRLVDQMSLEQKDFLIALLQTTVARNQGMPASGQVSVGAVGPGSDHRDLAQ